MPFDGFALEQGRDCTFRYVLRLWEPRPAKTVIDKEIGHLELEPYRVHVGHDAEGILISIVNAKPCTFLISEKGPPGSDRRHRKVRFFDTATGKWECPRGNSATDQAASRR